MTSAPQDKQTVEDLVRIIGRCADALDQPELLRAELFWIKSSQQPLGTFASSLFELELLKKGDATARAGLVDVAESLLVFWRDETGAALAGHHPALEKLWAGAAKLLKAFEERRFTNALAACWDTRTDAARLQEALTGLIPAGNRRVEFATCLYHLELVRLGVDSSRAQFARRAGLLHEAYLSKDVANELIGADEGIRHLWQDVVPYLDEFFESLEEEKEKREEARRLAEAAADEEFAAAAAAAEESEDTDPHGRRSLEGEATPIETQSVAAAPGPAPSAPRPRPASAPNLFDAYLNPPRPRRRSDEARGDGPTIIGPAPTAPAVPSFAQPESGFEPLRPLSSPVPRLDRDHDVITAVDKTPVASPAVPFDENKTATGTPTLDADPSPEREGQRIFGVPAPGNDQKLTLLAPPRPADPQAGATVSVLPDLPPREQGDDSRATVSVLPDLPPREQADDSRATVSVLPEMPPRDPGDESRATVSALPELTSPTANTGTNTALVPLRDINADTIDESASAPFSDESATAIGVITRTADPRTADSTTADSTAADAALAGPGVVAAPAAPAESALTPPGVIPKFAEAAPTQTGLSDENATGTVASAGSDGATKTGSTAVAAGDGLHPLPVTPPSKLSVGPPDPSEQLTTMALGADVQAPPSRVIDSATLEPAPAFEPEGVSDLVLSPRGAAAVRQSIATVLMPRQPAPLEVGGLAPVMLTDNPSEVRGTTRTVMRPALDYQPKTPSAPTVPLEDLEEVSPEETLGDTLPPGTRAPRIPRPDDSTLPPRPPPPSDDSYPRIPVPGFTSQIPPPPRTRSAEAEVVEADELAPEPSLDLVADGYEPDAATQAFWRHTEIALGLLPDPSAPRLDRRVLSTEGRAERKKLTGFLDGLGRRFSTVPEAQTTACLIRLLMAAQLKEKSLFGQPNPKRRDAFIAAFQLLSAEPLAAGHSAVWFELDGKETLEQLHGGLDVLIDFLQYCAREHLDPLDPAVPSQFFANG